MAQSYCIVHGCRFPSTHLTVSHKCGTCGKFGHGQVECKSAFKIDQLKRNSHNIQLPVHLYCTSLTCPCPWSHSSDAHYCSQCGKRHLESVCPSRCDIMSNVTEINRVVSEAQAKFNSNPNKIFAVVYSGQGCVWYVKRRTLGKACQLFFMHGDSWGQYGPQSDDRDKLRAFCYGYRDVDTGNYLDI